VMQMRLSYPLVSKWLTEHDCDLMTYLAKNYRKGEMPLSKLSAEEIAALSSHVVENTSDAADEKMAEASTSTTTTTTS
ncbi:hypothetical protein J8J17_26690, partial [Mycobacterium tuberculosis]|nr:hypothetical protein [Mycobacterium tuberculosis]